MDVVGLGVTHLKTSGSFIGNANHNSSEFCTRTTTNGDGASITCYSSKKSQDHSTSLTPHSVSLHGLADRNEILRKSHLLEPVINRNTAGQTFCSVGTCTVGQSLMEVPSHATHEKVGVLLLNLGGPDTLQDVQPFLFNLFADPDIIRLPRLFWFLQRPLAQLISLRRAPKSKEGYAAIGGGSPLRRITDEQILDNDDEKISDLFEEASDFIEHVEHSGTKVLVHCFEGKSRSATVVLAYLMLRKNFTLLEAWNTLKRVHRRAQPNDGFAKILLDLDRKLHGKPSMEWQQRKPPMNVCPIYGKNVGLSTSSLNLHLQKSHRKMSSGSVDSALTLEIQKVLPTINISPGGSVSPTRKNSQSVINGFSQ